MKRFKDINTGKIVEANERWAKVYRSRKDMQELPSDGDNEVKPDNVPESEVETFDEDSQAEQSQTKRKKKS